MLSLRQFIYFPHSNLIVFDFFLPFSSFPFDVDDNDDDVLFMSKENEE